ncbi:MAG: type III PLP-dependent enzyme domain-containing protein, partial [Planctomycetota bacterium]
DLGFQLAITSHPGSQCKRAETFAIYMKTARDIVVSSGLVYDVKRMNVGGGFPIGFPLQEVDTFDQYMSKIEGTTAELSKSGWTPDLICEPGRGMVASCVSLITQVKAIKEDGRIYINDGKYGAFEECRTLKLIPKFEVVDHEGNPKTSTNTRPRSIFGPTCDSDDVMPYELDMPLGLMPGDHIVFYNMGSYGSATTTDFNGYCSRDYVDLRGY